MKNFFFLFISVIVVVLAFSSCSKVESSNNEGLETQQTVNQEIISPNGVLMANSLSSLHEIINPSVENLFNHGVEFEITRYDFLEAENQTAMLIDILTKDGMGSRVILVKEYSIFRAPDKCYTITCDSEECTSCQPGGTVSNGSVTFKCEGSCACSMTVREHDCGKK
ncbi:MAG: hypothetical protein J5I94_14195 [Phaeodactylibacter sp.]|nr:hypothetical protein [Phaeodactylibacter sp.]